MLAFCIKSNFSYFQRWSNSSNSVNSNIGYMDQTKKYNSFMSNFHREAVVRMCSVKKVLLEIWQNSRENTCAKVSFSIKSDCEFCKISKNTCSYRTPSVAASVHQYSPEHRTYNDCVGCLSSKFHTLRTTYCSGWIA